MCVELLPIEQIIVRDDHPLRANDDGIESCRDTVQGDYGPLLVTQDAVLLDGRTRLEALRRNQATHCRVQRADFSDAQVLWRHMVAGSMAKPISTLNRLWRLLHAAREYEIAHPEARPVNVRGGPGRGHRETMADPAVVSFADLLAGPSRAARTIRRDLQVARALAPQVFVVLERSPDANNFQRLCELARFDQEVQVQAATEAVSTGVELRDVLPSAQWRQQHGEPVRISSQEFQIHSGDYLDVSAHMADSSVDLVLTDVPWQKGMRERFPEMADVFHRKLRPGGVAMVMTGQRWVPELIAALSGAGLEYVWLSHYEHTEPQCPPHAGVSVSSWYPVLIFRKAWLSPHVQRSGGLLSRAS